MGLTSSSIVTSDGDHFKEIINPKKRESVSLAGTPSGSPTRKLKTEAVGFADDRKDEHDTEQPMTKSHPLVKGANVVEIDTRASIIKEPDCEKLWQAFLGGPVQSFALSHSEVTSLMMNSLLDDAPIAMNSSNAELEKKLKEAIAS